MLYAFNEISVEVLVPTRVDDLSHRCLSRVISNYDHADPPPGQMSLDLWLIRVVSTG